MFFSILILISLVDFIFSACVSESNSITLTSGQNVRTTTTSGTSSYALNRKFVGKIFNSSLNETITNKFF